MIQVALSSGDEPELKMDLGSQATRSVLELWLGAMVADSSKPIDWTVHALFLLPLAGTEDGEI